MKELTELVICPEKKDQQDQQKQGQNNQQQSACCCKKSSSIPPEQKQPFNKKLYLIKLALLIALWLGAYIYILPFAQWFTYSFIGLAQGSKAGDALEFFIYDTGKILLLLVAMIYAIAWVRISLSTERIRAFLTGRNQVFGYFLGSGFGAITPFCSCSSIPLFVGFTAAQIPLGSTMAFLITSPLINEVAVVMLWGLLGWKFTLVYVAVGMLAGMFGGLIMDTLKAERWLQPFLLEKMQTAQQISSTENTRKIGLAERHMFALGEMRDIVKRVWLWVIIGVAAGAALHGYMPEEWISNTLGQGQWWSVPVSVLIGIPLYTNVTGIIPIMESLLAKGLPIGTTLALCMSSVAVSLPEVLMLKQVMRWQLLVLFLGLMLVIFTVVGWFFNAVNFVLV